MSGTTNNYNRYREEYYEHNDRDFEAVQRNKDGRFPWRCDNCLKLQHPDHDIMRSIYYDGGGPWFCGYICLYEYKTHHNTVRHDA